MTPLTRHSPTRQNRLLHTFALKGPCLDCAFLDNTHAVGGGLDKSVKVYDLQEGVHTSTLGEHEGAVRCLEYSPYRELLFSGAPYWGVG